MPFPDTRHTLIQRLARGGDNVDWQTFLEDYWGPVCGFALRRGGISVHDAEEIASETFEVLLRKNLLSRWLGDRRAKLRTMLCAITNRVQANHRRASHRRGKATQHIDWLRDNTELAGKEESDLFYAAWVEDLLRRCIEQMIGEYHRTDRGDYARVLYGRLCEGLTIEATADALEISSDTVNNYYRHAKKKLADTIRSELQSHVVRYRGERDEFESEWGSLSNYLSVKGGLEDAVRQAYTQTYSRHLQRRHKAQVAETLEQLGLA